jgi:hypothetical protein
MNKLRKFCAALILTLALTASTFAGNIECGGIVSTPPSTEAVAGDMQNGVESTDAVTEVLLFILSLI